MKYVFDECLPVQIAKALNILGKDTQAYYETQSGWERGTPDLDWIPIASKQGWCIVTSDNMKRPHEREALRLHDSRVIIIATKNRRLWDIFKLIINRWEQIEAETSKRNPPYILRVTANSGKPHEI